MGYNKGSLVRFYEVANVILLEKDPYQIYISKMKLNVNVPKYMRVRYGSNTEVRKNIRNDTREIKTQGGVEGKEREEILCKCSDRILFSSDVEGPYH